MRSLIALILLPVLIGFTAYSLQSCTDLNAAEVNTLNKNHLIFSLEAEAFVRTLEQGDQKFTGLFISYNEGALHFQKTRSEGIHLERVLTTDQPLATRIEIGADGKMYPVASAEERNFKFWRSGFDFAYFSWEDVKRLAEASDKIYLSGSMITYGLSIHDLNQVERADEPVFNFKLEGDFAKGRSLGEKSGAPDPLTLVGTACRRYWEID